MRWHVIAVAMVVLSATGAAHVGTHGEPSTTGEHVELSEIKQLYNGNSEAVPGFLASLIGDQRINLHIEVVNPSELSESYLDNLPDNNTVGIEMRGMKIESMTEGSLDKPTLEVWVDTETLQELAKSEQPVKEFSKRLQNGDIRYETRGVINGVRFGVARLGLKVAGMLGGL